MHYLVNNDVMTVKICRICCETNVNSCVCDWTAVKWLLLEMDFMWAKSYICFLLPLNDVFPLLTIRVLCVCIVLTLCNVMFGIALSVHCLFPCSSVGGSKEDRFSG